MERDQVDATFERLGRLLARQQLPTRSGAMRSATAGEFMLMGLAIGGEPMFKHQCSRNYLYVKRDESTGHDTLIIPTDGSPWERGTFDNDTN